MRVCFLAFPSAYICKIYILKVLLDIPSNIYHNAYALQLYIILYHVYNVQWTEGQGSYS